MTLYRGPIVLMYHGTPNQNPCSNYSIRAALFSEHLQYLKSQGWHTATINDLYDSSNLPHKTVILTFDDGYADNFENAFLPLHENNMKATWFIATNCIGKHAHWMGSNSPQTQMLTPNQLREMSAVGMEIGSHTCSHPDLSKLSLLQQNDELTKSKQTLENLIHKKVTGFAYPYGRFNEDSLLAVRDAGYRWACSTRPGWFNLENNPLLIRRITIFSADSASILARKLSFASNDVSWRMLTRYYFRRLKNRLLLDNKIIN